MRLNIHIIFDKLSDLQPSLQAPDETDPSFGSVRSYQQHIALGCDHLYLLEYKVLPAVIGNELPLSVVLINGCGANMLEGLPPAWKVIAIAGEHDPGRLLVRIQEIFEYYAAWQEDVLLTAMNGGSLQEVFDKAAAVLNNAIALIDIMQSLVMKAGKLPDEIPGSIWQELLEKGFAKLENLTKQQQHELNEALWSTEEPFFLMKVAPYSDNRHLIAPLRNEDKPFAMFGMSDYDGGITLGQISLVKIIQVLMKHVLLSDIGKQHLGDRVGYFVDRILQGYLVERGTLSYSLSVRKWELGDTYQILFFVPRNLAEVDDYMRSVQAMRIQHLLPPAYVFPYDYGILAILRNPSCKELAQGLSELERLCASLDLYCGMSMIYTGFLQIREAFIQAKAAVSFGGSEDAGFVLSFQEQYIPHLVEILESAADISSLCHPKVLRLWRHGSSKDRTLVQTLRCFLTQGCNANATARVMDLHRNTVIYRLERLRELLGEDLESDNMGTQLQLMLSCVLVERLQDRRQLIKP